MPKERRLRSKRIRNRTDTGCDMILNSILNMDCMEGLEQVPDNFVDLIVMDPPYELETQGGGAFGNANREYHGQLSPISKGITNDVLDVLCRKMKAVNIYIWCNKAQLRQYIDYFDDRGCSFDILTWHKTNPTPTCNNKYLSDTEYCIFARDKGVKLYGSYETKRKFYVTASNTEDKKMYGHPTVKPLDIIRNLIINSSKEEEVVMDPFMGSGTTAVACKLTGRHYIGFEIDPEYYKVACNRVNNAGGSEWF